MDHTNYIKVKDRDQSLLWRCLLYSVMTKVQTRCNKIMPSFAELIVLYKPVFLVKENTIEMKFVI